MTNNSDERVHVKETVKKNQRRTCPVEYSLKTPDSAMRALRIFMKTKGYSVDQISQLPDEHPSDPEFATLYVYIKERIGHSTNP